MREYSSSKKSLAVIKETEHIRYALWYEGDSEYRQQKLQSIVVLVSGVPGDERDFRYLAPLMSRWTAVVSIVFPGFGPLHEDIMAPSSIQDRAQYLKNIADLEDWTSIAVVGHSMGGLTALSWAQVDQRVRSLTFLCSVGVRRHRGMAFGSKVSRILLTLLNIPLIGNHLSRHFKQQMIKMGFGKHPLHKKQLALILRHVRDLSFEEVRQMIRMIPVDRLDYIGVIYTEDDPIVDHQSSLALINELTQICSKSQLQILALEVGGHNPQKHNRFEIDQWLKSLYNLSVKSYSS